MEKKRVRSTVLLSAPSALSTPAGYLPAASSWRCPSVRCGVLGIASGDNATCGVLPQKSILLPHLRWDRLVFNAAAHR